MVDCKIGTTVHFDAAHFIPEDKGRCHQNHGHRWLVDVEITGTIHKDGMVVNFKEVNTLLDRFDHKTLIPIGEGTPLKIKERKKEVEIYDTINKARTVLPKDSVAFIHVPQTTAENLAIFFHEIFTKAFKRTGRTINKIKVRVWESPKSYAETV